MVRGGCEGELAPEFTGELLPLFVLPLFVLPLFALAAPGRSKRGDETGDLPTPLLLCSDEGGDPPTPPLLCSEEGGAPPRLFSDEGGDPPTPPPLRSDEGGDPPTPPLLCSDEGGDFFSPFGGGGAVGLRGGLAEGSLLSRSLEISMIWRSSLLTSSVESRSSSEIWKHNTHTQLTTKSYTQNRFLMCKTSVRDLVYSACTTNLSQ